MKKILTLTIIALVALIAMATNVQAAEVSTWESVKTELAEGADDTVTFTGTATITDVETLDLNGKTLILNNSLVVDGGSLTITGNGTMTTEAHPLIDVKATSTLVLENGKYSSAKYASAVVRIVGTSTDTGEKTNVTVKANATLKGNYAMQIAPNAGYGINVDVYGTLQGITGNNGWNYGSAAIYVNGSGQVASDKASIINIYESAILTTEEGKSGNINDDDAPAIYAAGYANWNIYGGEFTGSEALSIKAGSFNITGGTFTATGEFVDSATAEGSGSEATGSAISITKNSGYSGSVQLSITNANVSSTNGYALLEQTTLGTGTAISTISVSGGYFDGAKGSVLMSNADEVGTFITGGVFTTDVKDYAKGTLTSIKDENGIFYVGTLNNIIIGNLANGGVTASLTQAVKGQTVTLTVKPEEGYQLSGLLKVYDSKGNEVTVTDGKFVMPDDEVTVKAEFEKIPVNDGQHNEEKDELDTTPDTGALNITSYVLIALATIVMITALRNKRTAKHSK